MTLKAGDYVQLTTCFHGLDEREWPDPLDVDFERHDCRNTWRSDAASTNARAPNLARSELRVFLEEWLKRIPEFNLKPGEAAVTATGAVAGVLRLPLVWPVSGQG